MAVSITQVIAPVAANLAAVAALQATTAATPLTLVSTTLDLGRQLAVTSTADFSANNFTIVGTDVNGVATTEVLAGPNNTTVYSVNLYKTITSITPSATNASTVRVGFDGVGDAEATAIVLEIYDSIAAMVEVVVTGTVNFTVKEAVNPIIKKRSFAGTAWYDVTALAAKSASTHSQVSVGISAIKVVLNTYSTGATVTVNVNQPSRGAQ